MTKEIKSNKPQANGFTIVELLVVIVIIGVLASISFVSYLGITKKASEVALESDLTNTATKLAIYKTENGKYPSDKAAAEEAGIFLPGNGTQYQYTASSGDYCITATSDNLSAAAYHILSSVGMVTGGTCTGHVASSALLKSWKQVTAGFYHVCAISFADQVYCWGRNNAGQLGNGSYVDSYAPVAVDTSGVLSGKTIKYISGSSNNTCAIASDNKVYCWGFNGYGSLGNGSTTNSPVPVAVDDTGVLSGKTIVAIDTSTSFTCALASDNQVYCWGYNAYGWFGNGTTTSTNVPAVAFTSGLSGKTIKTISIGEASSCVLTTDGLVFCSGYNTYGRLGNDSTTYSATPVSVYMGGALSGKTIKTLSVGSDHACVIASDDKLYCWGNNSHGQLGNDVNTESHVPYAVNASGALSSKMISVVDSGNVYTCAADSSGKSYCWGYNDHGQLGNNSTTVEFKLPVLVEDSVLSSSGETVGQLSSGYFHVCTVTSKNQTYCWGDNDYGQLGKGMTNLVKINMPVSPEINNTLSGTQIAGLGAGGYHNCAVTSAGEGYCWAYNNYGTLGDNTTVNRYNPVKFNSIGALGGKTVSYVDGGISSECAIASDNQAYCWGNNSKGQLGNNSSTTEFHISSAVYIAGALSGKTILLLDVGGLHSCAIASDYKAYCWGYGYYGQLGNGLTTDSNVPVSVSTAGGLSGKNISVVATGENHTCALTSDGEVYCWGVNSVGQLGSNAGAQSLTPVQIDMSGALSGKTILSIAAGNNHTCAVASDNKAYCWGFNGYGQLGDSSTTNSFVPVKVTDTGALSGKVITSIVAGGYHTCALAQDGKASCWGVGSYGQLGGASSDNSSVPVSVYSDGVLYGKTLKSLSVGVFHSCAIASDNKVYCWGDNSNMQLGKYYSASEDRRPFAEISL